MNNRLRKLPNQTTGSRKGSERSNQCGSTLLEVSILLALVAILALTGLYNFGQQTNSMISGAHTSLVACTTGGSGNYGACRENPAQAGGVTAGGFDTGADDSNSGGFDTDVNDINTGGVEVL